MAEEHTDQAEAAPGRYMLFRYETAPLFAATDIMTPPTGSPETLRSYDDLRTAGAEDGSIVKVLYRQAAENAFSLVHTYLKPGRTIPRHSHGVDCLYCVTYGEIMMGSQVLTSGDGVFLPADHPYTFRAGPAGAEFLEFRMTHTFDMEIRDDSAANWQRLREFTAATRDSWRSDTTPPTRQ